MSHWSTATALVTTAIALSLTGCGASNLSAVKGTVTFQGQPLKEGEIAFHPAKGRPSYGKIRDGQIVEVRSENETGAPLGACKVTITSLSGGGDMYAKSKSLIPERYRDPEKSQLTADIKPGGSDLKFELTP